MLEWLDGDLGLPFILWNFSTYEGKKRLTLAQNPQFYEGLPTFQTKCGPKSEIWPAEIPKNYKNTIYVLTNNEHRVVIEFKKDWRSFDNVWKTKDDTLILKSTCSAFPFFPN